MFLRADHVVWAQPNVEANEKRIAALPPPERAYERFRFWSTQLPSDQQAPSTLLDRYRAYLKSRSFASDEIDEQLRLVESQGRRSEIERWNRILTSERGFNTKPNEFLVTMASARKPGSALDVGMGQGRNAIWLAQQGWDVTGFDPAEKAVELALQTASKSGVTIKTAVKGVEDFDFGESRWDLILLSYVGTRGLTGKVERALKPGGVLIVEAFHRDATKGNSIGRGVVFDTGDLLKLFSTLRVVRYEEPVTQADFGQQMVRVVRYCGQRTE